MKTIATLVRVQDNWTYVSRSFERIDDEAIEVIRGCIEEDMCDEENFTRKEFESCFTPSFSTLKEDYSILSDCDTDFDREGNCIWKTGDKLDDVKYILHISLIA